jgi:hypothetical protein
VGRELALGAGRTLAALVAIGAAVTFGDAAARPLMAAYMLAPVGAAFCLSRALGDASPPPGRGLPSQAPPNG